MPNVKPSAPSLVTRNLAVICSPPQVAKPQSSTLALPKMLPTSRGDSPLRAAAATVTQILWPSVIQVRSINMVSMLRSSTPTLTISSAIRSCRRSRPAPLKRAPSLAPLHVRTMPSLRWLRRTGILHVPRPRMPHRYNSQLADRLSPRPTLRARMRLSFSWLLI